SQTVEPMQLSSKIQTTLDSYSFYEDIIASENSSPEESNDDDIHEYETSADVTSRSTVPRSS
ncbi:583_t:CDS:1, partial [Racocetra fulgida]